MMNFCLAGHRDNFYKNYRLQKSQKPWWFYFCQVSFPWLLLFSLRDTFSKAKEQVSPDCWGSVIRATNTFEAGTRFAPSFCSSSRPAHPGCTLCKELTQQWGKLCTFCHPSVTSYVVLQMKRYGEGKKWQKKYIREQIKSMNRVAEGQIEVSVAMLGETA